MKRILIIILLSVMGLTAFGQAHLVQGGFKIGSTLPCNRDYSIDGDELESLMSLNFGGFVRVGKYVSAEVGIGYTFMKGRYRNAITTEYDDELVETRYLQVPVKLVGYIPMGRSCALLPHVGIIYQPLLKVTNNEISFSKETLENNMTLLTTGLDVKLGFIVLGASYRYSFQKFFQDKDGKNPQFVNICAGFQF